MRVCLVRLLETLIEDRTSVGACLFCQASRDPGCGTRRGVVAFPSLSYSSFFVRFVSYCNLPLQQQQLHSLPPSLSPAPNKKEIRSSFFSEKLHTFELCFSCLLDFLFLLIPKKTSSLKHSWPRFEGLCPVCSLQSYPI